MIKSVTIKERGRARESSVLYLHIAKLSFKRQCLGRPILKADLQIFIQQLRLFELEVRLITVAIHFTSNILFLAYVYISP
jgi:hypothetical protein